MTLRKQLIATFLVCLLLACGSTAVIVFSLTSAASAESFHSLAVSHLAREEERIKAFIEPGMMSAKYLSGLDLVKDSRGRLTSYTSKNKADYPGVNQWINKADAPNPETWGETEEARIYLWYDNHPSYEKLVYDEFMRTHNSNDNYGLVFMANDFDGQYAQAPEGSYKSPGYDPRGRSWYLEAMADENEVTATSPYLTTGGGMVCSIMVKTYDTAGLTLGLLGIDYSLDSLTADLDNREILKTGYLVLFDRQNKVIFDKFDKDNPDYAAGNPEDYGKYSELRAEMVNRADGEGLYGVGAQGKKQYVVSHSIDMIGWKVAVVFEEAELLESSYSMLISILLTYGIVFFVAFAIIFFVSRRIVRPIESLTEAATIISNGNYEITDALNAEVQEKLNSSGSKESKRLGETLLQMLSVIQSRVETAEAANRAKSEFLSRMSHEIRTPMNAIMGMTQIAANTDDLDKIKNCLDKTAMASKHLLSLINDILDMSKIEANKLELYTERFDFYRMIDNAQNVIGVKAEEKRQTLTVDMGKNLPRFIIGDEMRLSQVAINLLSNAVKFTPEEGKIALSVALVSETQDRAVIECKILDTGIGIDAKNMEKLFLSFEQADGGIARKFGGTGLGLAISKRIVGLMGGDITVESEPGKGSVFTFTVNVGKGESQEGDMPAGVQADNAIPDFTGKTILIAEDIEMNREVAAAILEETHATIDFAENGLQAVEMFAASPKKYSLILMDVQMPEMDGLEATRRIRDTEDGKSIPIIALSANTFKADVDDSMAAGMNDHIGKPIDPMILFEKLKRFAG